MNQQRQFETADLQRLVRAEVKRQTKAERKQVAINDALRQRRQQTEAMLIDLKKDCGLLDQSIEAALESSPVRDPHHYAFPMTVRALIARRENLKATIALLLLELTKNDPERAAA
jgi:hypothetical protein